jgi:HAE1 family hydrophobic/amphiphilic exporter-1
MTRILALLAALLFALAGWSGAGEGALVVDPATAIRLAASQHPSVLEERERVTELEAQIREARSGALPLVEADARTQRVRDPALLNSPNFSGAGDVDLDSTIDPALAPLLELFAFDLNPIPVTNYYYGVRVEQTIYAFGKVGAGIRAAKALRERREQLVRDAEIAAARNALVALYGLALADSQAEVLAATRASREKQVQQAEDFLEIGTGTRLQLLQARAALSALRPREIEAEGAIARARAALNESMGRPALAPVRAAPGLLERDELPDPPGIERLVELGEARPEFKAYAFEREALDLQRKATRADLLPEVSFVGSYGISTIFSDELTNNEFASWDAGIYLTWKLFDGFETRSRAEQVSSRRRQNELLEERRRGELARDAVSALEEYRRAREAMNAAIVAVQQAEEALRVAEEESRWGAATTLDVLEAQRTLSDGRFLRLQAVHDALRARADLSQLVGLLPGTPFEETP